MSEEKTTSHLNAGYTAISAAASEPTCVFPVRHCTTLEITDTLLPAWNEKQSRVLLKFVDTRGKN